MLDITDILERKPAELGVLLHHWPAPWCESRMSSSWTSRFRTWTLPSVRTCTLSLKRLQRQDGPHNRFGYP